MWPFDCVEEMPYRGIPFIISSFPDGSLLGFSPSSSFVFSYFFYYLDHVSLSCQNHRRCEKQTAASVLENAQGHVQQLKAIIGSLTLFFDALFTCRLGSSPWIVIYYIWNIAWICKKNIFVWMSFLPKVFKCLKRYVS